jgi:hypothetical protein
MVLTTHMQGIGTTGRAVAGVGRAGDVGTRGAFGLVTGGIEFGSTIDGRLPLHSPVFAGLMLALIVAAAMTATAVLAVHGDDLRRPWLWLPACCSSAGSPCNCR